MKAIYDSYCGLYCGACPVLVANETGTVEKRAVEWKMKPEELRCFGCRSDTTAVFCTDCRIRLCAGEKRLGSCLECDEYPCTKLTAFRDDEHPHHSVVIRNLEKIRDKGLEAWLEEQGKRWSCTGCGTRFTWYDKQCGKCGVVLYGCKDEETDL